MNLPPAFITRMKAQLGPFYESFQESLQQPAAVSLRTNPAKVKGPFNLTPVPWAEHGYYLPERPLFTLDPWLHAGAYYVQEPSSMLLEAALTPYLSGTEPMLALDLCGAPGGKTTHLSSLLPTGSLLVSNEVIRSRAGILAENVQKWGLESVIVTNSDPSAFQAMHERFDLIVVDAPCSGEGLFRKDAKAISEWSPAHLQLCVDRQRRILADVWSSLKPGGLLLYSTCTFHPGENEENLAWLASQNAVRSLQLDLPEEWGVVPASYQEIHGYYAMPHRVRGEGFFFALIQKEGDHVPSSDRKPKRSVWTPLARAIRAEVEAWGTWRTDMRFVLHRDQAVAMPAAFEAELELIGQHLRIVQPGVSLGEPKKKDVRPAHALALCPSLDTDQWPMAEVDLPTARQYLRKDVIQLDLPTGWGLVCYEGQVLGWVKTLPNRVNNHYPTNWKIRMRTDSGAGQRNPFTLTSVHLL